MLRGCLLPETTSGLNHRGLFFLSVDFFFGTFLIVSIPLSDVLQKGRLCILSFVQGVVRSTPCSRGVPWAHPLRESSCLSWDHDLGYPCHTATCVPCCPAITLACGAAFKTRALCKLGMWHTHKAIIFILYLLTNCKSVILRMLSILASLQASLISLWKKKRCSLWLTAGLKWHI